MAELTFEDPKHKFCEELKAAREFRNLELTRVAEKTKISLPYLERIEAGDWDFLPHTYVRAFLRTYAQAVGLDISQVLEQFDSIVDEPAVPLPGYNTLEAKGVQPSQKPAKPKKKQSEVKKTTDEEKEMTFSLASEEEKPTAKRSEGGGGGPWLLWLIGLLVVVLAGGGAYLYYMDREKPTEPPEEMPFEEVVRDHESMVSGVEREEPEQRQTEPAEGSERETRDDTQTSVAPEPARLSLVAQARDRCFLKVNVDGQEAPVAEAVLEKDMTRSFPADSLFRVVIGNAAGIRLLLNGEDLGEFGEPGRVVTMTITAQGITNLRRGALIPTTPVEEDVQSPS